MRHTALWFLKSQINDFSDIAWTVHSWKSFASLTVNCSTNEAVSRLYQRTVSIFLET